MSPTILSMALACLAAGPSTAPRRADDQIDLVLLVEGRPVTARLHLRHGDGPYGAATRAWTAKLFNWFDRDGDGYLSHAEAARLLPAGYITSLAQDVFRSDQPAAVPFASLDRNRDGKVSLEEFRAYMRRDFPELAIKPNNERAKKAARVNDVLWRQLDADGDGKLSKEEVARLPKLVRNFDEDEDEQLTEAELLQEAAPLIIFPGRRAAATPGPVLLLSLSELGPSRAAPFLLRAYDRNGDGKLTSAELGLEEGEYARLDSNRDGKLDARELETFFLRKPDVTLRGRVGPQGGVGGLIEMAGLGGRRLELLSSGKKGLGKAVKRLSPDELRLSMGSAQIDLVVQSIDSVTRFRGLPQFYLRQFDTLRKTGAKGVTRAQAMGNVYVSTLFTAADRNGDGLLERAEFSGLLALVTEATSARVALQVDDGGKGLFDVIDADGNGRLSPREMRSAWSRIAPLCNGRKSLAREDLPRRVRLKMVEGEELSSRAVFLAQPAASSPGLGLFGPAVPAWFTKMDKNGDGDISRDEWLGSEEGFKRLDTDGDGLISVAEARKARQK